MGKVTSLVFNMLSRFVIAYLPRSKHLSISWLQSPSAVILEPKKIKSFAASTFSPFIHHEVMASQVVLVVMNPSANAGDVKMHQFSPWVGKIPWRRAWQPIPLFLPGESFGLRGLVSYRPWGCKESDTNGWLSTARSTLAMYVDSNLPTFSPTFIIYLFGYSYPKLKTKI